MMRKIMIVSLYVSMAVLGMAQEQITFSGMYREDSARDFSEQLVALEGEEIVMFGFAAPPLKPDADFFVLTRNQMAVCPFCETDADWPPDIVYIKLPPQGADTFIFGALKVTGILELGTETDPETGFVSRVRIDASRVERAQP